MVVELSANDRLREMVQTPEIRPAGGNVRCGNETAEKTDEDVHGVNLLCAEIEGVRQVFLVEYRRFI